MGFHGQSLRSTEQVRDLMVQNVVVYDPLSWARLNLSCYLSSMAYLSIPLQPWQI